MNDVESMREFGPRRRRVVRVSHWRAATADSFIHGQLERNNHCLLLSLKQLILLTTSTWRSWGVQCIFLLKFIYIVKKIYL